MKDKLNIALLAGWIVTTAACVSGALLLLDLWWLALCAVSGFCAQLLLCRVTHRGWLRAVPALPAVVLLILASYLCARDDAWDRLGALVFAFIGAVYATGVFFGWVAYLPRRKREQDKNEQ